jgi:hypothetical protein
MANEPTTENWFAATCTLPRVEQPLRVAEFDELFRTALRRSTRTQRTELELVISAESEPTARGLAERETRCCSYFRFEFDPTPDGLVMRIDLPEDHVDVLDALQARLSSDLGITTVDRVV